MRRLIYLLPLAALMSSCQDDKFFDDPSADWGAVDCIAFGLADAHDSRAQGDDCDVSCSGTLALTSPERGDTVYMHVRSERMAPVRGLVSRGTPTNQATQVADLCVNAFLTDGSTTSEYFDKTTFTKDGTLYHSTPKHLWPEVQGDKMSFYVLSPASVVTNYADTVACRQADNNRGGGVVGFQQHNYFSYVVPLDVTQQRDLLFASSLNNDCKTYADNEQAVPLTLNHLLTQVTFRLGADILPGQVQAIRLVGMARVGTYANGAWVPDPKSLTTFTLPRDLWTTAGQAVSDQTITAQQGTEINPGEYSFMMLPQQMPEGAAIEIEFFDKTGLNTTTWLPDPNGRKRTLRREINGAIWAPGQHVIYDLSMLKMTDPGIETTVGDQDACYTISPLEIKATSGKQWSVAVGDGYTSCAHLAAELTEYGQSGYWIEQDCAATLDANGDVATYCEQLGPYAGPKTIHVYLEENLTGQMRNIPINIYSEPDHELVTTTYIRQYPAFDAGDFYVQRMASQKEYIYGYRWQRDVKWSLTSFDNCSSFKPGYLGDNSNYVDANTCVFKTYTNFSNLIFWEWGGVGHFYANDNYRGPDGNSPTALTHVFDDDTFIQTVYSWSTNNYKYTVEAKYSVLNRLAEKVNSPLSQYPNYNEYNVVINGQTVATVPYEKNKMVTINGQRETIDDFPYYWKSVDVSTSSGLTNTTSLYNFMASTRVPALRNFITNDIFRNLATGWQYSNVQFQWDSGSPVVQNADTSLGGDGDTVSDTAVREALKLNKFKYYYVDWTTDDMGWKYYTSSGSGWFPTYTSHDFNQPVRMKVLRLAELNWYLPAPGEFTKIAADHEVSPMTGTLWTSYPENVGSTTESDWTAQYYDAGDGTGAGSINSSSRNIKRKIRCCRVKDGNTAPTSLRRRTPAVSTPKRRSALSAPVRAKRATRPYGNEM